MRLKSVFILFFLLSIGLVQSQVSFVAKATKKTLGINEQLQVDFEMNQDGDNFVPPKFKDFNVVRGPNQSVSQSWINGKSSYSKTYSYILAPKSQGTFTINQATIEVDGQIYKTISLNILVTKAVTIPKDANNPDYLAIENVHLIAEVSKINPYLNEAITVVYKLYVSNDVSITRSWQEIETPKFEDFWSQNIADKGKQQIFEGTFRGKPYRYVILRKAVLYPQKTGALIIEPLTLDIPIDVPGKSRDIFGRRRMTRVNRTISAGKRTITVKPLPLEEKPDNFSGAVGAFNFNVSTNKSTLDANEALELKIKVEGTGNLKLFSIPSLTTPSSIEKYDPEYKENVKTNIKGMYGNILDTYTLVPQFKGKYPISPVKFVFFDPKTRAYKSVFSNEIIINVLEGPSLSFSDNSKQVLSNNTTNNISLAKSQFKFIKTKPNLISLESLVSNSIIILPFLFVCYLDSTYSTLYNFI